MVFYFFILFYKVLRLCLKWHLLLFLLTKNANNVIIWQVSIILPNAIFSYEFLTNVSRTDVKITFSY